ncbi:MAG: phage tail assembly protein [Acidobacteriota bacterium]
MTLQTEYEFTLPKGYVDGDGNLHRQGVMRLANARDEILPLEDPRVRRNDAYLVVILLSRVITRLGDLREVNPGVIEKLFAADLAFLQGLYNRVNGNGSSKHAVVCPHCDEKFEMELEPVGES